MRIGIRPKMGGMLCTVSSFRPRAGSVLVLIVLRRHRSPVRITATRRPLRADRKDDRPTNLGEEEFLPSNRALHRLSPPFLGPLRRVIRPPQAVPRGEKGITG
jgi:hypothetical protein